MFQPHKKPPLNYLKKKLVNITLTGSEPGGEPVTKMSTGCAACGSHGESQLTETMQGLEREFVWGWRGNRQIGANRHTHLATIQPELLFATMVFQSGCKRVDVSSQLRQGRQKKNQPFCGNAFRIDDRRQSNSFSLTGLKTMRVNFANAYL